MVKILPFQCRGMGLIPGQGTRTPHAGQPKKKKKNSKTKQTKQRHGPRTARLQTFSFFSREVEGGKKSDFMCNPSFFKVVKKFEF